MAEMNFYGETLPVFRANLHTHTKISDGAFPPDYVVGFYHAEGYDVLAFSDHRKTNPVSTYESGGMTLLSGIELHPTGPRGIPWHLLALGVPEDFPGEYPDAQSAINAVAAVGGVVFAAHPHWCGLTSADILELHGLAGIEVYNTSCRYIGKAYSEQTAHELLDAGFSGGLLAVDDIHHLHHLFGGWTMIAAPDKSPQALLNALKTKHYYATQGPEFHRLSFHDGVFEAEFSEAVEVVLSGRESSGAVVVAPDYPMPGDRRTATKFSVKVTPRMKGAVHCRITDAAGKHAWTAPLTWDEAAQA